MNSETKKWTGRFLVRSGRVGYWFRLSTVGRLVIFPIFVSAVANPSSIPIFRISLASSIRPVPVTPCNLSSFSLVSSLNQTMNLVLVSSRFVTFVFSFCSIISDNFIFLTSKIVTNVTRYVCNKCYNFHSESYTNIITVVIRCFSSLYYYTTKN